MLEIDGLCIVQCEAILRYLARKNDMLGADLAESVRSHERADALACLPCTSVRAERALSPSLTPCISHTPPPSLYLRRHASTWYTQQPTTFVAAW